MMWHQLLSTPQSHAIFSDTAGNSHNTGRHHRYGKRQCGRRPKYPKRLQTVATTIDLNTSALFRTSMRIIDTITIIAIRPISNQNRYRNNTMKLINIIIIIIATNNIRSGSSNHQTPNSVTHHCRCHAVCSKSSHRLCQNSKQTTTHNSFAPTSRRIHPMSTNHRIMFNAISIIHAINIIILIVQQQTLRNIQRLTPHVHRHGSRTDGAPAFRQVSAAVDNRQPY